MALGYKPSPITFDTFHPKNNFKALPDTAAIHPQEIRNPAYVSHKVHK